MEKQPEISDQEFAIQAFKILIGIVGLIAVVFTLIHINLNLATIVKQNAQIIKLLDKKE